MSDKLHLCQLLLIYTIIQPKIRFLQREKTDMALLAILQL